MKLRIYYKPVIDGQVAKYHSSITVPLEEEQDGGFQLAVQTLDESLGAGNYDYLYHERINDDEPEGDALTRLKRIKEK